MSNTYITITCSWELKAPQTYNPSTRKEAWDIVDNADDSDIIELRTPKAKYKSEKREIDYEQFEEILLGSEEFKNFLRGAISPNYNPNLS